MIKIRAMIMSGRPGHQLLFFLLQQIRLSKIIHFIVVLKLDFISTVDRNAPFMD